jgi:hypothetical protein
MKKNKRRRTQRIKSYTAPINTGTVGFDEISEQNQLNKTSQVYTGIALNRKR